MSKETPAEILAANTPAQFTGRNVRPKFRRLRSGDLWTIEIEIEESVWQSLRTIPETAFIEITLWHHDGDTPEQSTPKINENEKGPWGDYWHSLFRDGLSYSLEIREVLNCEPKDVRTKLHEVFQVSTLTNVSPDRFVTWLNQKRLFGLVTLSRQVEHRMIEFEERANR